MQSAANEIVARVRRQASRLDTMLSSVLDAVERAGAFMADAVAKPMRQLSAVLASAKAVVESLRSAEPASRSQRESHVRRQRYVCLCVTPSPAQPVQQEAGEECAYWILPKSPPTTFTSS